MRSQKRMRNNYNWRHVLKILRMTKENLLHEWPKVHIGVILGQYITKVAALTNINYDLQASVQISPQGESSLSDYIFSECIALFYKNRCRELTIIRHCRLKWTYLPRQLTPLLESLINKFWWRAWDEWLHDAFYVQLSPINHIYWDKFTCTNVHKVFLM